MNGFAGRLLSSPQKFREAMSDIQVIALEDENECRAVTQNELESFENCGTSTVALSGTWRVFAVYLESTSQLVT